MVELKTERRTITPRPQTIRKKPDTREEKMIAALSPNLNIMVQAARTAGRRLVRDFGEVSSLQVSLKGPGDFVSNADTMSENTLIECLLEDRPDYGVISEERQAIEPQNNSQFTWIIDPIDGTTNFLHAIPYFSISIALKFKNEIIAGVIYNPITNELYYAEKGKGAFIMMPTGNVRLRVSGRAKLSYALVGSNGFSDKKNREMMEKVVDYVASIRYNGCTTLAMAAVAAGQCDLYVATRFKIWDLAVGYLLVKEAGGYISDINNSFDLDDMIKTQTVIAGNSKLKEQILKVIGD